MTIIAEVADETRWSIVTDTLSLTWSDIGDGEVQLTSLRTAGREWIDAPVPLLGLAGDSGQELRLRDVFGRIEGEALTLSGRIEPGGLTLESVWTVDEASSIVVGEITIRNQTADAVELGSLTSLRLNLPRAGGDDKLSVLAGGRWDESMPPRGYRLQTFDLATINRHWFGAADDGRSSGEYVPWFGLTDTSGGLLAGLVWSGRWRLDAMRTGDSIELGFGISEFMHRLAPGEAIQLPGLVLAGFAGDIDTGANVWRHWLSEYWMPVTSENWPWVQYNHWYAYYGDIDETRLFAEAEFAAAAGCEVFVIDDGWFQGRLAESYFLGWGDWTEDRTKFPRGLREFGDRIRRLGMTFGLWMEPERADQTGELVRSHPDWLATRGGEPIYRHGRGGAEGVHLCLGNPDVQRWMADDIIRVIRDYGVDWLKWDYNMGYGLGCDATDHGHQAGDGHHAHTLGLYRVLGELRAACPDLMIENCASGGHRIDLGMLRHTHTNWISDYTHRAASCRQHVQGAGLFLPLAHLNSWVLDKRDTYEFRSRMGGAFGVSDFMGEWSESERASLALAVNEYKRLRPFLSGERFLLTGPLHQDWEVWQFVHPNSREIALLAFREGGQIDKIRIHLQGIATDRSWHLTREGESSHEVVDGQDLAGDGVTIALPDQRTSALFWLTPIGSD